MASSSFSSRSSPLSSAKRRVIAINHNHNQNKKKKKKKQLSVNNTLTDLQSREISSQPHPNSSDHLFAQRFRNLRFTERYDTHDPNVNNSAIFPLLSSRAKVTQIVIAGDIILALAVSGACAAFRRGMKKRICFLNIYPDEFIQDVFYNKSNDSLITVSQHLSDPYCALNCRSTKLEYIQRGQPDAGLPICESDTLICSSFVEFDDINGKLVTYSALESLYKVYDLNNYALLYAIADKRVKDIKISPGILLVVFKRAAGRIRFKLLSIEDGTVLKDINHLVHLGNQMELIELCNDKLLVKQKDHNLQIIDVVGNDEVKEVSWEEFTTPASHICLHEKQLFLEMRSPTVSVWNLAGELVTSFDALWHPNNKTNTIFVTSNQRHLISFCKSADSGEPMTVGKGGCIIISNIWSGKCLAKIMSSNVVWSSKVERLIEAEALQNVTTLYYDEERNEIYIGNKYGFIHVLSN